MNAKFQTAVIAGTAIMGTVAVTQPGFASSHMDAPLITLDDSANTTDVYAFRSQSEDGGTQYLMTALAVYPFEEPGIGPNNYRFDDRVRYEIHIGLDDGVAEGRKDITYRFEFKTRFKRDDTILQAYLGEVEPAAKPGRFGENQNMRQTYKVTKIDHRTGERTILGRGMKDGLIVPPNNQGLVTPFYNQDDNGDNPAREGVSSAADLDPYTFDAIAEIDGGHRVFAGQRDDGFYADIQSIFDLDFSFGRTTGTATKPFDSQGGFNVHTIVLSIPLSEFDGAKIAGVYATTSRAVPARGRFKDTIKDKIKDEIQDLFRDDDDDSRNRSPVEFVQVGRQGNPLFAEALVALRDKDRYNQTEPTEDDPLFGQYADDPEVSRLLNVEPIIPGLIRSIFIPDVIKVDLTTDAARLSGQTGFDRLGFFGGDMLKSEVQDPFGNGGFIPGGWPNGRRFGDDVVDVALIALGAAGTLGTDYGSVPFDGVSENDITFNTVFPYAATPLNGRVHGHHGDAPEGF
jgi:hypothetical protein